MGFWPPWTEPWRAVPETDPVEDVVMAGMPAQPERRRVTKEAAIAAMMRITKTPIAGCCCGVATLPRRTISEDA
jgi:hypothetical protein